MFGEAWPPMSVPDLAPDDDDDDIASLKCKHKYLFAPIDLERVIGQRIGEEKHRKWKRKEG